MRSLLFFVLGMLFLLSLRAQEENAPLCKVEFEITHDIKPPDSLESYKVFIAGKNTPEVKREICHGEFISPGPYIFTIIQPAYESVVVEKQIPAEDTLYVLQQLLRAKKVTIRSVVSYDIPSPRNLPPHEITFFFKKRGKIFFDGDSEAQIRPGSYHFKITQLGYRTEDSQIQVIDILPSEEPYVIKQKMVAKKRGISFELVDSKCRCLVDAHEIVNLQTNKKVKYSDKFQPGCEYKFRLKFKKYLKS